MKKSTQRCADQTKLTKTLVCGITMALAPSMAIAHTEALTLNDIRILSICPSQPDALAKTLTSIDWEGFPERDLRLVMITNTTVETVSNDGQKHQLAAQQISEIRRMSDCRTNDAYVLVGKDGAVKRRWSGEVSMDELFQTIDAMPMQKYEIKWQRGK